MGIYYGRDGNGRVYPIRIKGEQPSDTETQRITSFLASKAPVAEPEAHGGIGQSLAEFGKGAAEGFGTAFTEVPRGIASIGTMALDPLGMGYLPDPTKGAMARASDYMSGGIRSLTAAAPGYEDSFSRGAGNVVGTIGSFVVPTVGAEAATVGLLGKAPAAIQTAQRIGRATAVGQGAVYGASDQANRIAAQEDQGVTVSQGTRNLSTLLGSALGASLAIPVDRIAQPLAKLLGAVPAEGAELVAKSLATRLKEAAVTGGLTGVQNALYAVGQDLTEQGLYNPKQPIGESMLHDLSVGGAAGTIMHFTLSSLLHGKVVGTDRASKQLAEDLAKENEVGSSIKERMDTEQPKPDSAAPLPMNITPESSGIRLAPESSKNFLNPPDFTPPTVGPTEPTGISPTGGKIIPAPRGVEEVESRPNKLSPEAYEVREMPKPDNMTMDEIRQIDEARKKGVEPQNYGVYRVQTETRPDGAVIRPVDEFISAHHESLGRAEAVAAERNRPKPVEVKPAEPVPAAATATAVEPKPLPTEPLDPGHPVVQGLTTHIANRGLENVAHSIRKWIAHPDGEVVEGAAVHVDTADGPRQAIELAHGIYEPGISDADLIKKMSGVIDHEQVHILKRAGVYTDPEWRILERYVANKKLPGKEYTYLQKALAQGKNSEEAIAESFRDWASGDLPVTGQPRSLLARMANFVKRIGEYFHRTPEAEKIFGQMARGELKSRNPEMIPSKAKAEVQPEPVVTNEARSPQDQSSQGKPTPPAKYSTIGSRVAPVTGGDVFTKVHDMQYAAAANLLADISKPYARLRGYSDELHQKKTDNFVRRFTDNMIGLARMIDNIKRDGGTVPDAMDGYLKNNQMSGKIETGLRERDGRLIHPMIEALRKVADFDVKALPEVGRKIVAAAQNSKNGIVAAYMYALHAPERNRVIEVQNPKMGDAGSGMTTADAEAIVKAVQGSKDFAQIEAARKSIRDIIDDTKKTRFDGQLAPDWDTMPPSDIFTQAGVKPGYEHYVPLRNLAKESVNELDQEWAANVQPRVGKKFQVRGDEDMTAHGRATEAGHILEHVLQQNQEAIFRSAKNEVGNAFYDMVVEHADKVATLARVVDKAPLIYRLVDGQVKVETPEGPVLQEGKRSRLMPDYLYKNKDQYFTVKRRAEDGTVNEHVIEIYDDNVRRAMKGDTGLGNESIQAFVGGLNKVTRLLANTVTTWNPEFMFMNFPRDVLDAMSNINQYGIKGLSKDVAKHVMPAMRVLWQTTPETRLHQLAGIKRAVPKAEELGEMGQMLADFRADGGYVAFHGMREVADHMIHINEQLLDPASMSTLQRSKQTVKNLGEFIEAYNTTAENATRLAVYTAMRKALEREAKTPEQMSMARSRAAQAAKEMSTNFNRGGETKQLMNSLYMFYNASIQGSMMLAGAAKRSPAVRRLLGGIFFAGIAQDAMMSMFSDRDKDGSLVYDKIPEWVLQHRMVFMDPTGLSERGYFVVPMPMGYSAFFNAGRAVSRWGRGGYDAGQAGGSALGALVDAFNPVGGTASWMNFVAPTVLDPMVDIYRNRDFANRPIAKSPSESGVHAPASQLYWNNTSDVSKSVAEWVNQLSGGSTGVSGAVDVSPDVLEFLYTSVTGGAGKFVGRLYSLGETAALHPEDFADMSVGDVPVARAFVGNVTTRNDTERFMEIRQEVLQPQLAIRQAQERGDSATIINIRKRYPQELKIAGIVQAAASQRDRLSRQLKQIQQNERIAPERKAAMEKILKQRMNDAMGRAIGAYNNEFHPQ